MEFPDSVDSFERWVRPTRRFPTAGSGRRYAPEFKARLVELSRAGRSADRLSCEFDPSATAIRRWVAQADRDEGVRKDGLTTVGRREVGDLRRVKLERDILARATAWFARESGSIPKRGSASWAITRVGFRCGRCAECWVSPPVGNYAHRSRGPSPRTAENEALTREIVGIHEDSGGTYGAPRVHAELRARGHRVSENRVARLMRRAEIAGVSRRRKCKTTCRAARTRPAPDLVERDFSTSGPDELWVGGITCILTKAGFLHLAFVVDARSRRVVGWSMAAHLRTSLVLDAFDMVLSQRQPDGVIHHFDQESQYTSCAFGERCWETGVRPSMGSVGDAYDNSMCESFFATLECELIERRVFRTGGEARREVLWFIEGWYTRGGDIRASATRRRWTTSRSGASRRDDSPPQAFRTTAALSEDCGLQNPPLLPVHEIGGTPPVHNLVGCTTRLRIASRVSSPRRRSDPTPPARGTPATHATSLLRAPGCTFHRPACS